MDKLIELIGKLIPFLRGLPVVAKWGIFVPWILIIGVLSAAVIFTKEHRRWEEETGDVDMNQVIKGLNALPESDLSSNQLISALRPLFKHGAFMDDPRYEDWGAFAWVVCRTWTILNSYVDNTALDNRPDVRDALDTAMCSLRHLQQDVSVEAYSSGAVLESAMKFVDNKDKFTKEAGPWKTPQPTLFQERQKAVNDMLTALRKVGLAK
jgi:hypothetical protein